MRRRRFLPGRRFSAYAIGGSYWVTIERLAFSDEPNIRWVWTVRTIVFTTSSGGVVPSQTPFARGYAWTKAEARAVAYQHALNHQE